MDDCRNREVQYIHEFSESSVMSLASLSSEPILPPRANDLWLPSSVGLQSLLLLNITREASLVGGQSECNIRLF